MFDLTIPSFIPASEPDYDLAIPAISPSSSFLSLSRMPAGMKEAIRRKLEGDVLHRSDYEWLDICPHDPVLCESYIRSIYENEEWTLP